MNQPKTSSGRAWRARPEPRLPGRHPTRQADARCWSRSATWWLGASLTWLAAACATSPQTPAAACIWVVDDGFHKGILVPAGLAPLRPDLQYPVAGATVGYVEYGYSERDWILGTKQDLRHIWDLTVAQGLGVLVVQSYPDLDSALLGRSYRAFPCSKDQLEQLGSELSSWIDVGGSVGIVERPHPMYVISSSRPYTLLHNCRWFADSVIRRMRIDDDDSDVEMPAQDQRDVKR